MSDIFPNLGKDKDKTKTGTVAVEPDPDESITRREFDEFKKLLSTHLDIRLPVEPSQKELQRREARGIR
jgi:hypothetical protein